MKSILKSKTFWIAVIQAVIGITVVVLTELDMVGYVAIAKSIGDIILRLVTSTQVRL